jgi:hypothetical protein
MVPGIGEVTEVPPADADALGAAAGTAAGAFVSFTVPLPQDTMDEASINAARINYNVRFILYSFFLLIESRLWLILLYRKTMPQSRTKLTKKRGGECDICAK